MDILEAIHTRQTIGQVKPDPIPRELIEKLLATGARAPNHHKVRPWRFVVLIGPARERLGEVVAASLRQRAPDATDEVVAAARAKPLRAPLIIAIGVDKPNQPKVVEIENICAAATAAQNILLAAHALGLAAKWSTGAAASDPKVKSFLGLAPDQHLIAFLYLGYPWVEPTPTSRPAYEDRTVWME